MLRIIMLSIILAGCVSSKNVRYYHAQHGVVNGEHEIFIHDSKQCVIDYQNTSDSIISATGGAGVVAKELGEQAIGNVLLGAEAVKAGYKLAKNQSSCMKEKGWLRLENAK